MEFIIQYIGGFADSIDMELYLMRHGHAENESASGKDFDRRLSDRGRALTHKFLKSLGSSIQCPDVVLHSPYDRARETAEIFGQEFGATLRAVPGFRPMDLPSESLAFLAKFHKTVQRLVVVSHEPHISSLTSLLLTGREEPILAFDKAGLAALNWSEQSGATLRFFLRPDLFE